MNRATNNHLNNNCLAATFELQKVAMAATRAGKKQRRRSVRFHKDDDGGKGKTTTTNDSKEGVCCQTAPPLFEALTEDICQRLWFQTSEISAFRNETRKLILFGKQSENDELAGLERFNLERSSRKKTAIQFVLLAQMKGGDADFIQGIASECSQWAVTAGLLQGFQDFCAVYDPLTSLLGSQEGAVDDAGTYNDCFFGKTTASATEATSSTSSSRKRKSLDALEDSNGIVEEMILPLSSNAAANCPLSDQRVQRRRI